MRNMEDIIYRYHAGFQICTVCSGLFLFCSILLFFRFGIMKMISDRTGRTVKKSIRRMEKSSRAGQRQRLFLNTDMLKVKALETDSAGKSIEDRKREEITGPLPVRFRVTKRVILIHTDESQSQ